MWFEGVKNSPNHLKINVFNIIKLGKTDKQLKCLGYIIRDNEIGREFGEQEEGTTTIACVTSQSSPDEEVEEKHCQTRQEDECNPFYSALHPPEVDAD